MIRKLLVAALVLAGLPALPAAATLPTAEHRERPVIFVHGSAGSGLQFQTQAKRLASNGYPAGIIEAHDYDSTTVLTRMAEEWGRIDARVERLLAATGADRVDMLGHSLGTFVMQGYLTSSPERAARVAHYVNLDGRTATALPGGVPTLAIWGEGATTRTIVGATNVYLSDQAHTETVTSVESFVEIYRFFNGRPPATTRIVPDPGRTTISGLAVLFPSNVGVSGARLEVYEVSVLTGARRHQRPAAVFQLAGDGRWGPMRVNPFTRYEFAIVRENAPGVPGTVHHIYFEPFRRTDHLVRLLTSLPGQGLGALMETGPAHVNLNVSRNREWWADQADDATADQTGNQAGDQTGHPAGDPAGDQTDRSTGIANDRLWVNGVNVLTPAVSPRVKRTIGVFMYDRGVDRTTDTSVPIPAFFSQPFITGVDVYIPTWPRVVLLAARQRGSGEFSVMNVPAWPSADANGPAHRISVQFDD